MKTCGGYHHTFVNSALDEEVSALPHILAIALPAKAKEPPTPTQLPSALESVWVRLIYINS